MNSTRTTELSMLLHLKSNMPPIWEPNNKISRRLLLKTDLPKPPSASSTQNPLMMVHKLKKLDLKSLVVNSHKRSTWHRADSQTQILLKRLRSQLLIRCTSHLVNLASHTRSKHTTQSANRTLPSRICKDIDTTLSLAASNNGIEK